MPKERFHLLIADRCYDFMKAMGNLPPLIERNRQAYLFGSISPDVFFYDLPFFGLAKLGNQIHRLEGGPTLSFLAHRLGKTESGLSGEAWAWMLGASNHLIADSLWHPIINALARSLSGPCPKPLSQRHCHHWIESEMEGYWLKRLGPADGYASFLRKIRTGADTGTCIRTYVELLAAMGFPKIPDAERARWCFFWQASLLRLFSRRRPGKMKPLLLRHRTTRYLGALLVPPDAAVPPPADDIGREQAGSFRELFRDDFITRAVAQLSGRLDELAAPF